MAIIDGRYEPLTKDEILDLLMDYAFDVFGPNLNPDDLAVIRTFYEPVAVMLRDIQMDLREVLNATQLEYAQDRALDLLTALIGVRRNKADSAIGEATFSRDVAASTDYVIPKGTVIQTDEIDAVRFQTTETAILPSGNTQVANVAIEAIEPGIGGNVGSNAIVVMPDPPTGIEHVTNPNATHSGERRESDDDLRERAKDELSQGMNSTAIGIYNALVDVDGVKSVSLFVNDTNSEDASGRPGHSFEAVVECTSDVHENVGKTILTTKAAGDGTVGGARGNLVSLDLPIGTGQTMTVEFSKPTVKGLYIDMNITTTDVYEGDSEVKDEIVHYVGGVLSSGDEEDGNLRVGDDVIYRKIIGQIMSVNGVADVSSLNIGFSSSPTSTTNLTVAANEMASVSALDSSITITK
ncbi:baseplate J/gp47 family protein [Halocatena halophila]|uniref:baseplate J/gp47 family protein n=1 Tax=Halocatena halophila TaxID=2814576 RepID=UPI002ED22E18